MLDPSTEARITEASERFMAGELSAGEMLDRATSALWTKGEDGIPDMALQYDALPGGDGGAWVEAISPARHLAPVAHHTNGNMIDGQVVIRTIEVRLGGHYEGLSATMRVNPRRSVLDGLKSGDTEQAITAAYALIVRWNLRDEETGEPIPLTREHVYDLPDDLLAALLRGYFETFVEAVTPDKSDAAGDSGLPR